jgi:hypothetical protein
MVHFGGSTHCLILFDLTIEFHANRDFFPG